MCGKRLSVIYYVAVTLFADAPRYVPTRIGAVDDVFPTLVGTHLLAAGIKPMASGKAERVRPDGRNHHTVLQSAPFHVAIST